MPRKQERQCHLFMSPMMKVTLHSMRLSFGMSTHLRAMVMGSTQWHDLCCRYHKVPPDTPCLRRFLWCIRANAWKNQPHGHFPIDKDSDRTSSSEVNSHRWPPQECSHANRSTYFWWFLGHLPRQWSPVELKHKSREKVKWAFLSLARLLTWQTKLVVVLVLG